MTLDYRVLAEQVGTATLEDGSTLSAATVRRLACDAQLIPMVLGADSVPLDVGREHRLVRAQQRNALIARDKGCAFPPANSPHDGPTPTTSFPGLTAGPPISTISSCCAAAIIGWCITVTGWFG